MIFRDAPLGWGYFCVDVSNKYFVVKKDLDSCFYQGETDKYVKVHKNNKNSDIKFPSFFLPVGVI